jgi:hypothetical protein
MQTRQRKIPFPDGEKYGHWTACLPEYQKELDNFKKNLQMLKSGQSPVTNQPKVDVKPLSGVPFKVLSDDCEIYEIKKGSKIFTDSNSKVQMIAPEIDGLTGVRFGMGKAITEGATVKLELEADSKVLIGYMKAKGIEWLQLPELETNTHADDRGGLTVIYENAVKAESCPAVNIHAYSYEKGIHEIYFGTGAFIIAGVVSKDAELVKRNAGFDRESYETLDWLYEGGNF